MRKYKVKPYDGYYYYKQRKYVIKRIVMVGCFISLLVCAGIYHFTSGEIGDIRLAFNEIEEVTLADRVYFEQTATTPIRYEVPEEVKAVYLPAGYISKLDEIVELANTTEVNAVVLDVKDDFGYLTFESDNPQLQNMLKSNPPIKDIEEVIDTLYKNNIYPIARIVTFKDKVAEGMYPERMVTTNEGEIFTTPRDEKWLNPYDKANWDYILEVCYEAIELGFKEIQFDYIRFHESMRMDELQLPTDVSKTEIINEFVDYMYERLHAEGVIVSADVFGTIITSKIDAEIVGQDYKELIKRLDYICPMIYPSHYGTGSFGIEHPDLDPYGIIFKALQYSNTAMKEIPRAERKAEVRPWLQDFTAPWVTPHQEYGGEQVREQIDATYDALIDEWILWNAAGNYSIDGLEKE